jgi:hypothetical protein
MRTRSDTMKVAFAGPFAPRLAEAVKPRLALPSEIVLGDENAIVARSLSPHAGRGSG